MRSQAERRGGRPWTRRRAEVLRRDGHTCTACGAGGVPLEIHHIEPVADGGGDGTENLTALCLRCHTDATYGPGDRRVRVWDDLLARRWGR